MRICASCGRTVLDGAATVCPSCGAALDTPAPTTTPPSPSMATSAGAPPERRKRGSGPLAVALAITLAVAVVAGIAFGAYVLTQKSVTVFPRVVATVTPTATVPANAVLDDALSDNHNDWTTDTTGDCYFSSDGYHVSTMTSGDSYYVCGAPIGQESDGSVTVTARQVAGKLTEPYGVAFRGISTVGKVDNNTFYWFAIVGDGAWALFLVSGSGTYTRLGDFTLNSVIRTGLGQRNTLSVQFRGQTFTCMINGKEVGIVTDPGPSIGRGGVGLIAGETVNVAFTDFVATT